MYLIVAKKTGGGTAYYGPFPTAERARKYTMAMLSEKAKGYWTSAEINPLIIPFVTVVRNIGYYPEKEAINAKDST